MTILRNILEHFARNEKVTEATRVGDILRLHPEAKDTLLAQGLRCFCPSTWGETLGSLCRDKGLNADLVTCAVNVAIQSGKR